ncbi:hypothetical protein BGX24_001666 [Mortierella sp. AD032]|nr:hypothetical protein BGX24_001666 [Mortierella sp. AD032]
MHFFSPNTTSYLQSMNAEIIRSFKAMYCAIYVQHLIDEYDYDYNRTIDKIDITIIANLAKEDSMSVEEWLDAEKELVGIANRIWILDEVANRYTQREVDSDEQEPTLLVGGTPEEKKSIEQLKNYWLRQERSTFKEEETC